MPFTFERTELEGVVLIKPKVFGDERGYFMEAFNAFDFEENGINFSVVQFNESLSKKGVLRGIHYQLEPYAQAKIVRCAEGKIFDVAVDLRKSSKTFGKWVGFVLSEEEKNMVYIPRGFGHAFLVLSERAKVQYLVDNKYMPSYEFGIRWNDEDIAINWQKVFPEANDLILSEKDKSWPTLKKAVELGKVFE